MNSSKNIWILVVFTALFHGGMTVSKTLHPLWFEMNNKMSVFGLSYSLMALAGYFSFFAGPLANRFGARTMLLWGSALYGCGLALRVFPNSVALASVSGVASGLGASMALVSLKPWVMEWAPEHELGNIVGKEHHATSIGAAGGLIITGLLAATLSSSSFAILAGLLLAAIGPLIASLLIARTSSRTSITNSDASNPSLDFKSSFAQLFEDKKLALATSFLGLLTGFYMAMVGPYVPLLLTEQGLTLLSMIGAMLLITLVRIYAIPKFTLALKSKRIDAKYLFLWGELIFAAVMLSFYFEQAMILLLLMLCVRSVAMAASAYGEQLAWMKTYTKKQAAVFFSLAQGFFFLGDALGGLTAGLFYGRLGVIHLMVIGSVLVILNAALTFLFFLHREKQSIQEASSNDNCRSVC